MRGWEPEHLDASAHRAVSDLMNCVMMKQECKESQMNGEYCTQSTLGCSYKKYVVFWSSLLMDESVQSGLSSPLHSRGMVMITNNGFKNPSRALESGGHLEPT